MIGKNQVKMEEAKVEAIVNWLIPKLIKDV